VTHSFLDNAYSDSGPEKESARSPHGSGRLILVAGGRYDTVCPLPVRLRLPVAGRVAAYAA